MSKTEEELRREGFFVTLDAIQKAGVMQIVQAYNMGLEEGEDSGRVRELEAKVSDYKGEVRGLNLRIGREQARHDERISHISKGVAQLKELLVQWQHRVRANGYAISDDHLQAFAFVGALEKEVAR